MLPTGSVTFLFTDIEGSTQLWEKQPQAMQAALAAHDALLRSGIERHGGRVFKTVGDAFYAVFTSPRTALDAALDLQRALLQAPWPDIVLKVRMALHTGEAETRDNDYFGPALNRVARLLSAGHGGQVLLSTAVRDGLGAQLPPGVTLRDMGERRLKDLIRPEHIFQALRPDLPGDFPPLRTLDTVRTNLPAQLTSFIGRENEVVEVRRLLGAQRLVTLTGAGGTGKTRLAQQAAALLLDDFSGGVWLVELASITDPALVAPTLATALQLRVSAERSPEEAVTHFLEQHPALLLLDNCEHLIQPCAELTQRLLQRCPRLTILATSREALGIAGETIWSTPSFSVPDREAVLPLETLLRYDAVQLFVERARAVQPGFVLTDANAPAVTQICARLDGIPLAIELAAARVRGLQVEQIAARLNSRFRLLTGGSRTALPRQQTLVALVDWSYALLSESEKQLFERLAVFSGPFTLEAAEQVGADSDRDALAVLELLQRLVDKSLVVAEERLGETFYHLLETMRQYGRDKLLASEQAEPVSEQHARYFLGLAIQADIQLRGPDQLIWLRRLGLMRDSLRSALQWFLDSGQMAEAFQYVTRLNWFWFMRADHTEGRQWLQRTLALPETAAYRPDRTLALTQLGFHTWLQLSAEQAQPLVEDARAQAEAQGDRWNLAFAEAILALVVQNLGQLKASLALAAHSAALFAELGDEWNLVHSRFIQATTEAELIASCNAFRRLGDRHMLFPPLLTLSYLLLEQGQWAAAAPVLRDALQVAWEFANQVSVAIILGNIAAYEQAREQDERAVCLAWASRAIFDFAGAWGGQRERTDSQLEAWQAASRARLSPSAFAAALERGRAMTLEQAVTYALAGLPAEPGAMA